jgi:gamma-glutamyltranspeptidase
MQIVGETKLTTEQNGPEAWLKQSALHQKQKQEDEKCLIGFTSSAIPGLVEHIEEVLRRLRNSSWKRDSSGSCRKVTSGVEGMIVPISRE